MNLFEGIQKSLLEAIEFADGKLEARRTVIDMIAADQENKQEKSVICKQKEDAR